MSKSHLFGVFVKISLKKWKKLENLQKVCPIGSMNANFFCGRNSCLALIASKSLKTWVFIQLWSVRRLINRKFYCSFLQPMRAKNWNFMPQFRGRAKYFEIIENLTKNAILNPWKVSGESALFQRFSDNVQCLIIIAQPRSLLIISQSQVIIAETLRRQTET